MTTWDDGAPMEPTEEDKKTQFADLDAFVRWLADTYRRPVDGNRYACCTRWRQHPEVVSRLEGLWGAYEALHDQKLGLCTWWLSYADPTMAVLLSTDGPLRACAHGHCDDIEPLPLEEG